MSQGQRSKAIFGLLVLSLINLVNYLDRYIIAGVMPKLETEFSLSHTQGGLLATVFMVVYMVASPLGGYLGDRVPRRFLIAASVFIWSLATVGSGLAPTFFILLVARAVTGIGEAGYGTVAPAFIADLFKREDRSRMLSFFYLALPLGAALGFVLGGWVSDAISWHAAFFVGGAPGIALAAFAFWLPEPVRGGMDGEAHATKVPFVEGMKQLGANSRFWLVSAGLTMMAFSIGGLATWMPSFLEKERGFSGTQAGLVLGATTVVGGLVGTLVGGLLGDVLDKKRPGGGILLSGVGLLAAAPFMVAAAHFESSAVLVGCLLLTQALVFLNQGPLNAAIVNAVPSGSRAFAMGVNVLLIHLLGDAASPVLIGLVADHSSLATAITFNAIPVALGGLVLLWGVRLWKPAGP